MSDELANRRYTLLDMFRDGGAVAAGSAIVGSVLFALIDTGIAAVRSLIDPAIGRLDSFLILWFILLAVVGSLLSLVPAIAGGCGLAFAISGRRLIRSKRAAMLVAGSVGMIIVTLTSFLDLYVMLSAHDAWTLDRTALLGYLLRLAIALCIAAGAGGYTARRVYEKKRE